MGFGDYLISLKTEEMKSSLFSGVRDDLLHTHSMIGVSTASPTIRDDLVFKVEGKLMLKYLMSCALYTQFLGHAIGHL